MPLQGASDHIVSEAIYLADPEGNGIEVYADRPITSLARRLGRDPHDAPSPSTCRTFCSAPTARRWAGFPGARQHRPRPPPGRRHRGGGPVLPRRPRLRHRRALPRRQLLRQRRLPPPARRQRLEQPRRRSPARGYGGTGAGGNRRPRCDRALEHRHARQERRDREHPKPRWHGPPRPVGDRRQALGPNDGGIFRRRRRRGRAHVKLPLCARPNGRKLRCNTATGCTGQRQAWADHFDGAARPAAGSPRRRKAAPSPYQAPE